MTNQKYFWLYQAQKIGKFHQNKHSLLSFNNWESMIKCLLILPMLDTLPLWTNVNGHTHIGL